MVKSVLSSKYSVTMAEAVAALSLAANILQALDYGRQFVTAAWKIWISGQESMEGIATLQILSKDLDTILSSLQAATPSSQHSALTDSTHAALVELAGDCTRVTKKMLQTLQQIGLPSSGRKRDAIKAAFKLLWNNDEIKALEVQLSEFRNQLTLRLLISVR